MSSDKTYAILVSPKGEVWGAESAADSLFMIKRSSRVPVLAFPSSELLQVGCADRLLEIIDPARRAIAGTQPK